VAVTAWYVSVPAMGTVYTGTGTVMENCTCGIPVPNPNIDLITRLHFIHWVIEDGKLVLIFCPTGNMVADLLTKALPSPKVKHFTAKLGLRNT
jgi:hypothetical protein